MKLIDYDGVIHNLFDYAFKHYMREESGYEVDDIFMVEDHAGTPVLRWTQRPSLSEKFLIELEFEKVDWLYLPLTRVEISPD